MLGLQPCDCPRLWVSIPALSPSFSFGVVRREGIDEAIVQAGGLPLPELDARGPKPEATPGKQWTRKATRIEAPARSH